MGHVRSNKTQEWKGGEREGEVKSRGEKEEG